MKKTRIIIALVLVLCLTIPFRAITTEASANITVTNYDELYVAVDNAHNGDTINIGAVIPIEWGVYMNDSCKDITLKRVGNGKIVFVNPYGDYNNSFWFNFTFDCQGVSPEEFFDTRCENFDVILTDCRFINTPAHETDPPSEPPTESGGDDQGESGTGQTEQGGSDTNTDTSDTDTDTDTDTNPDTGTSDSGQESTESGTGEGSTDSGTDSSGTTEEGQDGQQEGTQQPSDGGQTEGEGTLTPPTEDTQEPPSDNPQQGTEEGAGETVPPETQQPESGNQEGTQQPSDQGTTTPPEDNGTQHPSDDGGTTAPPSNETDAPDTGGTEAPNTAPSDTTLEEPQQGGTEQGNNTQPEQGQNGQGDTINNYVTNDNTVTNNDNRVTNHNDNRVSYYTTDSGTQQQTTPSVMTVPSGSNVTIFINGEQVELEQGQDGLTITINAGQTEEETEAVTEGQPESNYPTGNLTESEDLIEGSDVHNSSFNWSIFFDIIQTILLLGIVLILLRNSIKKH